MGFVAFLAAMLLGAGLAYMIGRKPVFGGLYAGIGFAVTMFVVHLVTHNPHTAFALAVPLGLGACFLAPPAEKS